MTVAIITRIQDSLAGAITYPAFAIPLLHLAERCCACKLGEKICMCPQCLSTEYKKDHVGF